MINSVQYVKVISWSNSAAALRKKPSSYGCSLFTGISSAIKTLSLKTDSIPSKIKHSPFPPASTTPAFFKTGSNSGVVSNASAAPLQMADHTYTASSSMAAAAFPFSQATRETVKMVPSVGFITAL